MSELTALGEICSTLRETQAPRPESEQLIWYFSIPAFDQSGAPELARASVIGSSKLVLTKPCVLFSRLNPRIPRVWDVSVLPKNQVSLASTEFVPFVIEDHARLDSRYLYWFLQSKPFVAKARAGVRAATKSRERVEKEGLFSIRIPLPPLAEQRRIAAVLDKADAIGRKRQESIRLLDEFLRSTFLEMFGDPVRNEKGWEPVSLTEACNVQLGKMLTAKARGGTNPVPYLRNANVQWRRIDLTSLFEMDFNDAELARFDLQVGDLLVCEGGEVGRCAIWEGQLPRCSFQKAVHRVRPKTSRVRVEYLQEVMYSLARAGALARSTSQATIAHLTKIQLEQLELPLPPEHLQGHFVRIYRSVRQALRSVELRFDQADTLFSALSHRAFQARP